MALWAVGMAEGHRKGRGGREIELLKGAGASEVGSAWEGWNGLRGMELVIHTKSRYGVTKGIVRLERTRRGKT